MNIADKIKSRINRYMNHFYAVQYAEVVIEGEVPIRLECGDTLTIPANHKPITVSVKP